MDGAQVAYAAVREFDVEMEDLQAVLHYFKELRISAQVTYSAHISLLAPVRRLPVDVLSEIFLFSCSQGLVFNAGPDNRVACEAPVLLLSAVCHFWRNIVLTQPSLWDTILI
ncbi:hypothetical protein DL96DRAFT_1468207, partial [Flagelloscypha sp. PMI_526]